MKKVIIIALCTLVFTSVKSQIYVQGGLNLANISNSNSGATDKNKMITTFNAGILGRSNSSGVLAVESGLLVDGRGAKVEGGSGSANYKVTFNPLYLELPVNLVIRVPFGSAGNFFVNGGPYVAMGIAGKSKFEGQLGNISGSQTKDIKFTSTDPTADDQAYSKLKRFDYGLNVGAGIDLNKILLKVNYGYGLAKINSMQTNNNENNKDKYRTLSISLGIPFSR